MIHLSVFSLPLPLKVDKANARNCERCGNWNERFRSKMNCTNFLLLLVFLFSVCLFILFFLFIWSFQDNRKPLKFSSEIYLFCIKFCKLTQRILKTYPVKHTTYIHMKIKIKRSFRIVEAHE